MLVVGGWFHGHRFVDPGVNGIYEGMREGRGGGGRHDRNELPELPQHTLCPRYTILKGSKVEGPEEWWYQSYLRYTK